MLNVSEMDYSIFSNIKGYNFITSTLHDLGINIRIGTAYEEDPLVTTQYRKGNISMIWDCVDDSDLTAIDTVEVEGYAFVVTLDDVLNNLDSLFGENENTDRIESLTSFANPAFAFMVDRNLLDIFMDEDLTLLDMLAIGFIPDYDEGKFGSLNYFIFKGVVYNVTNFLGVENVRGIPLFVIDEYEQKAPNRAGGNGTPSITTPLNDIITYANPSVTWFKTEGFLSGTTAKNIVEILDILSFVDPTGGLKTICKLIEVAPLDIGIYVMTKNIDDITYTVPVILPTASKGKTYLGEYVELNGFYVNLDDELDKIKDLIDIIDNITAEFDWFKNIYNKLIGILNEYFGHDKLDILNGFFIASIVESIPNPNSEYQIDSFNVDMQLLDNEGKLMIKVDTSATKRCNASLVVQTPDNRYFVDNQNTYFDKDFSFEIITIDNPVEGDYNFTISLVSYLMLQGKLKICGITQFLSDSPGRRTPHLMIRPAVIQRPGCLKG